MKSKIKQTINLFFFILITHTQFSRAHNNLNGGCNNHCEESFLQHNFENKLENINDQRIKFPEKSMEIVEEGYRFIRDDAIGDMLIKDLENEAIKRTLKFFNNNRRKTAKSLGVSERTIYRKIDEYSLEPKIKASR